MTDDPVLPGPCPTRPTELVVAGGGIARVTTAVTAARAGLRTLLMTGDVLGHLLSIEG